MQKAEKSLLYMLWERFWGYFNITVFTASGFCHFVFILFLLPLKLFSSSLFQQALTFQLVYTVPGFACIPFSWRAVKVTSSHFGWFQKRLEKDQLIIANHSARIDYMTGMYVATYFNQRVSFVAEAMLTLLPIVGWHRYLSEDMFVYRSFLKDADRLSANIQQFKNANVKRWLFLCPEGYIADYSKFDREYISNCKEFCKQQGIEPFEMVLTPRYKGITIFKEVMREKNGESAPCFSATFNYIYNGECAVKPLTSKERVVPDIWAIVTGDLECHFHVRSFELSGDPKEMKHQLLHDYSVKDKVLRQFYNTGKMTPGEPGKTMKETSKGWEYCFHPDLPIYEVDQSAPKLTHEKGWYKKKVVKPEEVAYDDPNKFYTQELPSMHYKMNASLAGQLLALYLIFKAFGLASVLLPGFLILYFVIALSHILGETIANGQSRESIPFEGLVKAILLRLKGIEGGSEEPETSAKIHFKAA